MSTSFWMWMSGSVFLTFVPVVLVSLCNRNNGLYKTNLPDASSPCVLPRLIYAASLGQPLSDVSVTSCLRKMNRASHLFPVVMLVCCCQQHLLHEHHIGVTGFREMKTVSFIDGRGGENGELWRRQREGESGNFFFLR